MFETTATTPFARYTRTPRPIAGTTVDQQGETPAPQNARLQAWQAASEMAAGHTPAVPVPIARELELNAPALRKAVVDKHFEASTADDRQALTAALEEVRTTAGLSEAETNLLAKALALTFRNGDAQAAKAATAGLAAARQVRLVDDLLAPPASTQDTRRAWTLALNLQRLPGGAGLSLMDKISSRLGPDGQLRKDLDTRQRGMLGAYLEAAGEVHRAEAANRQAAGLEAEPVPAVDPGSIYASGNIKLAIDEARLADPTGWPGRAGQPTPARIQLELAEKALLAVRDELDPNVKDVHGCRFAVQLVRGGMLTNKPTNPDRTPSEYAKGEARALKTLGTQVDRAIDKAQRGRSWRHVVPNVLGKEKTPFSAYQKLLSSGGANVGFDVPNRGGIHDGRAVKDMIDVLQAALTGHPGDAVLPLRGDDLRVALAGGFREPAFNALGQGALKARVRQALLAQASSETSFLTRFAHVGQVSEQGLSAVRERVLKEVAGAQRVSKQLQTAVDRMLAQENQPLTPQRLTAMLTDTLACDEGQLAGKLSAGDHAKYTKALARARDGEAPHVATPALNGLTREAFGEVLASMVATEELGSGINLADRRSADATLRGLTEVFSKLFSFGSVGLRADIGGGGSHAAFFGSDVGTAGSALRMGVSTTAHVQDGVGASLGIGLNGDSSAVKLGASVGGDVGARTEVVKQQGVVFQFPRHLSGGVNGDRDLSAQKAQLVRLLFAVAGGDLQAADALGLPRPGNPEDQRSLLASAAQGFGDGLSIGNFESTQHVDQVSASVSAGAGLGAGAFNATYVGAGLSGRHSAALAHYQETSGWLRVSREVDSTTHRTSVTASGAAVGAVVPQAANLVSGVSVASAAMSAQVGRGGVTNADIIIRADGQTLPTSFTTQTFDNLSRLERHLAQQPQFAAQKAAKYPRAADAENPRAAAEREAAEMANFLARQRQAADPTDTAQLYWERDPQTVQLLNHLEADLEACKALGDSEGAQRSAEAISQVRNDPARLEARFLVKPGRTLDERVQGLLSAFGGVHKDLSVTQSHLGFT